MDGEAGWWTTSGNIGLPPLARVMGVGRQQQQQTFQAQSLSSSQTTSRDAKPTQHIEITHHKQRKFKTGVPQGGILSPTLFNIYTTDLPPPSAPVQVMAYADDITSTHTSTSAAKKYIQPYLHKVFVWTKQNNLLLNPDKTTCTLFTPDPAEYTSNLDLTINNKVHPWQRTQRFWVLP